MSKLFLKAVDGGWIGIASTRFYSAPRECEESAEAQEREFARRHPRPSATAPEKGSAEEARFALQEESLENIDLLYLEETKAGYQSFCANHPEYVHSEKNLEALCEYFHMDGVRFALYQDAYIPLAVNAALWEKAYEWKMAMGQVAVNPSVMNAKQRLAAQKQAQENAKRGDISEQELYDMPIAQLRAMGFEQ